MMKNYVDLLETDYKLFVWLINGTYKGIRKYNLY